MNPTPVSRPRLFRAVLYCLFLGIMVLTIRAKKNYHMDEISSYGLSNHVGGINMSFEQGVTYTPAEEPFLDYLTVDKDNRFNYENVITNQELDVHPPLYYLILHTICSVRAGTFSKWYAAFINFFFALMTLFMLRKLIRELTYNDEFLCAAASVIFVMSAGVLSIVSFLRMYVMAMFWVTAVTWLFVSEIGKWKYSLRFFAGFFLITVLGALTHYYCIIYTVLLCTVYCIILLAGKRWKPTLGLIITSALGGYISYCLFPAMTVHMFEGYRGKEALGNLQNTVSEFFLRVYGFFQILNREIFGGSLEFVLIGVIFLSVLRHMNRTGSGEKPFLRSVPGKKKKPFFHRNPAKARLIALKHAVILIPCALYFLFVAKSAAYVNARYISPIFAVVMASVFCLIASLLRRYLKRRARILALALLMFFIVINGWRINKWEYLYRDDDSARFMADVKSYSDADCLFIYDFKYKIQGSYEEIRNYNSVTFVSTKQLRRLPKLEIADNKKLIVLISGDKQELIDEVLKAYPQLTAYEELGKHNYSTTIRFYEMP